MTRLVKPLLAPYTGIDGVILSNGDGLARGAVIGESAWATADCYGLRRVLPAARAQETMIIATSATGSQQARSWVELYGSEQSWLDWALDQFQLPSSSEIWP
jgi:hypothetical protein